MAILMPTPGMLVRNRVKRACKDESFNSLCNFLALVPQRRHLVCETRQDDAGSLRIEDDYGLLRERLDNLGGLELAHAWGRLDEVIGQLLLAHQPSVSSPTT